MSSSDNSTTNHVIVQNIIIGLGIPILIFGVFGGILNIIVFLTLKTFRQSSCVFFLLIMSFVNIGQLIFSLFSRIMISGFLIDWTSTSSGYCKFRNYALQVCALMSNTCMCLAAIDQFLATSLRPQWQQFLNVRKARFICILSFVIWLIHGIPTLIWYNLIPGQAACIITNSVYSQYIAVGHVFVLTGFLPFTITVLFGSLAYWNVRQIPYRVIPLVRRELDKQLTSIVLVQIIFNVFAIVPTIIMAILRYSLNFTNNSINVWNFNMAYTILTLVYYLYFASPFYIYIFVSKRFQQQLVHVLTAIHFKWGKHQMAPQNRVTPDVDGSNEFQTT